MRVGTLCGWPRKKKKKKSEPSLLLQLERKEKQEVITSQVARIIVMTFTAREQDGPVGGRRGKWISLGRREGGREERKRHICSKYQAKCRELYTNISLWGGAVQIVLSKL
jgi:hypothetical protein